MSFVNVLDHYRDFDFEGRFAVVTPQKVDMVLSKERLGDLDLLTLLSSAAQARLEQMAQKAHAVARRYFGRVVSLFTPFYISNFCDNVCAYCSFARQHDIVRRHLSFDEIGEEARRIAGSGIRHILVLTGESHSKASVAYLAESVRIIREYFSSVGVEIYPLTREEYGLLIDRGVDGLTLFQETYNESAYHRYHDGGPKDDFQFRLDAPDRACGRGMRTVSVGSLMGLGEARWEAFMTGLHALYLQRRYPGCEVSISVPRMRPLAGTFEPPFPVADALFVQIIMALRIFLTSVGITLSTRESRQLRDACVPLGITKMSAGVSTAVGGHSSSPSTTQFEISDDRTVDEMKAALLTLGYQPVMQDWNSRF